MTLWGSFDEPGNEIIYSRASANKVREALFKHILKELQSSMPYGNGDRIAKITSYLQLANVWRDWGSLYVIVDACSGRGKIGPLIPLRKLSGRNKVFLKIERDNGRSTHCKCSRFITNILYSIWSEMDRT